MRKIVSVMCIVCLLMMGVSVYAQEATTEPGMQPSVMVRDQISLNGMVLIDSVTSDVAGYLAIHATDENGGNPHVVGIAPVQPGTSQNLAVMIDGAMATPFLTAQLHIDDTTPGVFEYGKVAGADMPVSMVDGGQPAAQAFKVAAIAAYDQQPVNDTVVVASVISEIGGWLAIHADQDGQIGAVLGQAQLAPGTNPAVMIPINAGGQPGVVWAVIHADNEAMGTFEFDPANGVTTDLPLQLGDVTAARPIMFTSTPPVMLADGTPLMSNAAPTISLSNVPFANQANTNATVVVENVVSVGQGFVDIHADDNGHPSHSLGHTLVQDGQSTGVTVDLTAMPGMAITPVVWPMLHQDTNGNGLYEYLMIPGTDLPVVYNGAVVTIPANIGGDVPPDTTAEATADVTAEATADSTAEATADATSEATAEATSEATAEATVEVTDEPTAEATTEVTVEVTDAP